MMTDLLPVGIPAPRSDAARLTQAQRALRAIDHDHDVAMLYVTTAAESAAESAGWAQRRGPVVQRIRELGGDA